MARVSKFLDAYEGVIRAHDKQGCAFWSFTDKRDLKKKAVVAATTASPQEGEVWAWYTGIHTSKARRVSGDGSDPFYTPERDAQGRKLLGGIRSIWVSAKTRQAALLNIKTKTRKRRARTPEPATTPAPVNVFAVSPVPDFLRVNEHANGNGQDTPAVVFELPAVMAYRRMARNLDLLPHDEAVCLALDCGIATTHLARKQLEGEGYAFAYTDGGWQVQTRPFDRERVLRRIEACLYYATDEELKIVLDLVDDWVQRSET